MAYEFTTSPSKNLAIASAAITSMPFTFSCWFQVKKTTASETLIYIYSTANSSFFLLTSNGSASPKRAVQILALNPVGGIYAVGYSNAAYSANTWYHAACVCVSPSNFLAYFNGTAGSQTTTTTGTAPTQLNNTFIGGSDTIIADCGIWNAALTAAEIASLSKGMTCDKIRPQSLVFYTPLVRNLQDVKGGRTITNNNGATVAAHPRVYA